MDRLVETIDLLWPKGP